MPPPPRPGTTTRPPKSRRRLHALQLAPGLSSLLFHVLALDRDTSARTACHQPPPREPPFRNLLEPAQTRGKQRRELLLPRPRRLPLLGRRLPLWLSRRLQPQLLCARPPHPHPRQRPRPARELCGSECRGLYRLNCRILVRCYTGGVLFGRESWEYCHHGHENRVRAFCIVLGWDHTVVFGITFTLILFLIPGVPPETHHSE